MPNLTYLAPLACAAPMGLMFWMMSRDRGSRDRKDASTSGASPASQEIASLRSEVARLREQSSDNTEDGVDSQSDSARSVEPRVP